MIRPSTVLRVNHSQLATIRLRLAEAIMRKEQNTVTVSEAVDRAKAMAQRLLNPITPKG